MKKKTNLLILIALVILNACTTEENSPSKSGVKSLGVIPAEVSTYTTNQVLVVENATAYVATKDGIWKKGLSTADSWSQTGLAGFQVHTLINDPKTPGKMYAGGENVNKPSSKPFYYSVDAGKKWTATKTSAFNKLDNKYEPFYNLVISPANPSLLYANMSGTSINVSSDGGKNWKLANGVKETYFGYPSVLGFLPNQADVLYQGSEAVLDHASLRRYFLNDTTPDMIGQGEIFIGKNYELSNRRPNSIYSAIADPNSLYVGLEGALIRVEGDQWEYIFKSENDNFPYAYIKGIWLNPADKNHIIFGGEVNGEDRSLSLFQTKDGGKKIEQINLNIPFTDPAVVSIAPSGKTNEILLLITSKDGEEK